MAHELEAGPEDPVERGGRGAPVLGGRRRLGPDGVHLQHVGGRHDEVGGGAEAPGPPRRGRGVGVALGPRGRRPLRGRGEGGGVGGAVGDEAGGAVLDARRPVHHLVRRVAHLGGGGGALGRLPRRLARVLERGFGCSVQGKRRRGDDGSRFGKSPRP